MIMYYILKLFFAYHIVIYLLYYEILLNKVLVTIKGYTHYNIMQLLCETVHNVFRPLYTHCYCVHNST